MANPQKEYKRFSIMRQGGEKMKKLMMTMFAACAVAFTTFAKQCGSKTEDVVQCKRQAEGNSKYCWQHLKGPASAKRSPKTARSANARPSSERSTAGSTPTISPRRRSRRRRARRRSQWRSPPLRPQPSKPRSPPRRSDRPWFAMTARPHPCYRDWATLLHLCCRDKSAALDTFRTVILTPAT